MPLGSVIALVDVLIENNSKSSVPSNSFIAIVFVAELSSQIVPATAEDGLDVLKSTFNDEYNSFFAKAWHYTLKRTLP